MPKKSADCAETDLGVALAILRTIRGLTQQQLGQLSGVRGPSISEYESGKMVPGLRTLKQLLQALDLPLSALEETEHFIARMRSRSASTGSEGRSGDLEAVSSEVGRVATLFARTLLGINRGDDEGTSSPTDTSHLQREDESQVPEFWNILQELSPAARVSLVEQDPAFRSFALARFLTKESITAAGTDPKVAASLAELAVSIARRVEGLGSARLLGYAMAHLANARRAGGDLAAAERTFAEGERHWSAWRQDAPDLLDDATYHALKASFRRTQGRFDEALALHDLALASRGADAIRCELLVSKAYTLNECGDLAGVVETLRKAADCQTGAEDPRLLFALRHNLLDALSKAGYFREAKALLPEVKRLVAKVGRDLHFARVQWVEGRIQAGLGNLDEAVALLKRVRGVFMSEENALDAALVTLELAVLLIAQGKTASVKDLARNLATLFRVQALPRESLAALQLFRQAAEAEAVTTELAEQLVVYLRRSRYNPELRFETN